MTNSFELTEKQKEARSLLGRGQRHSLLFGGSRSTKTFTFCYAISTRAIRAPESRHLISRLHNVDVRQSVFADTLPKMMSLAYPEVSYRYHKSDMCFEFPNGSEIWGSGLDDKERVDKILGKEYATIFVNEASQVAYASVETLRTRLAQNVETVDGTPLPLRAYYDLNPTGRAHWTYKEFILGQKPTGEAVSDPSQFAHMVMNPMDNPHLPAAALEELQGLSGRKRKRFFEGEYLADVPGALWNSQMIEAHRVPSIDPAELDRIVVAVDPQISAKEDSDETGIIVAGIKGRGANAHAYVLQDLSGRYTPAEWAKKAVWAYDYWNADMIIAEGNQGGEMVRLSLTSVRYNVPVKIVYASRGKDARAEPIAAFYEQGRVHHVGVLRDPQGQTGLEDQLCSWVPGEGPSPDRLDANVWALTVLMGVQVSRKIKVVV